ncbi:MAG: hypothetical protein ACXAEU_01930 [Candidatus Hodarchaeales archaeon]
MVKSKTPAVQDVTGRKHPLKRLFNLPNGKYNKKILLKRGFTDEDIAVLEALAKQFEKIVVKTSKRKIPLIIFKEGMLSIPRPVRLVPILIDNFDKCIPKKWFEQNELLQEILPVFVERGLLKEGCYEGEEFYYWGKNPMDDDWVREICLGLGITLPPWPDTVFISKRAKNYRSISDFFDTEKMFFWNDRTDWYLTLKKPDNRKIKRWFTVRLKKAGCVDIPPAVWKRIGHDSTRSVMFDVNYGKKQWCL